MSKNSNKGKISITIAILLVLGGITGLFCFKHIQTNADIFRGENKEYLFCEEIWENLDRLPTMEDNTHIIWNPNKQSWECAACSTLINYSFLPRDVVGNLWCGDFEFGTAAHMIFDSNGHSWGCTGCFILSIILVVSVIAIICGVVIGVCRLVKLRKT